MMLFGCVCFYQNVWESLKHYISVGSRFFKDFFHFGIYISCVAYCLSDKYKYWTTIMTPEK